MTRVIAAAALCNPIDVFRRPDPAADAVALRAAAQLTRSAALLADATLPHQPTSRARAARGGPPRV